MSQESSVVCLYPSVDAAEAAVRKLGQGGFPIQHVSIIAKDLGTEKKSHGFITRGSAIASLGPLLRRWPSRTERPTGSPPTAASRN